MFQAWLNWLLANSWNWLRENVPKALVSFTKEYNPGEQSFPASIQTKRKGIASKYEVDFFFAISRCPSLGLRKNQRSLLAWI
jgi:hypothetical protein